jgi:hypothetical protein
MFKIYVFVYDISLQNVFIGSVLNRKKRYHYNII